MELGPSPLHAGAHAWFRKTQAPRRLRLGEVAEVGQEERVAIVVVEPVDDRAQTARELGPPGAVLLKGLPGLGVILERLGGDRMLRARPAVMVGYRVAGDLVLVR